MRTLKSIYLMTNQTPAAPPEPEQPTAGHTQGHLHRRASDRTPEAATGATAARPSRKRTWAFVLIIAISVVLIGSYYAARRSDSWIIHWKRHTVVRDLASLTVRINAAGLPVREIGRVQADGAWLPVLALRRVSNGAKARVCVFSGVHGNEPAAVEAALRFAESLRRDATLYAGVNVTVVPLVNPWGWARNLRRNSANQDISRTFMTTPSVEGEMVKALLKTEGCNLVADLHGDSTKQPFHIITFDNADLAAAKAATRAVAARGLPLRKGAPEGVFVRRDKDAINTARPSLGLYARRHGVAQVYNIQSPREIDIEMRVNMHLLALDHLVRAVKP